jgi:hypothetical protein
MLLVASAVLSPLPFVLLVIEVMLWIAPVVLSTRASVLLVLEAMFLI